MLQLIDNEIKTLQKINSIKIRRKKKEFYHRLRSLKIIEN